MNTYEVAHINEQGVDVILILVASRFGSMSSSTQAATLAALERCAHRAGLAGTAVLLWQNGNHMSWYGPRRFSGYLNSITPWYFAANVNQSLTCG